MSAFDDRMAAIAMRLLDEYGVNASVTIKGVGRFDPATGLRTDVTDADAVTKRITPPSVAVHAVGGLGRTDSMETYMTPIDLPSDLKAFDKVKFAGVTYSVTSAINIYSGEDVVLIYMVLS